VSTAGPPPPAPLGPRFAMALGYAAEAHAGQLRKGTPVPYVSHLLAVTGLVLEDGGDEDAAIMALLHDVVEDQGGRPRLDDVRERFGTVVADGVQALSDTLDKAGEERSWHERKSQYLADLERVSDAVVRVSLADKLHNARAVVRDLEGFGPELWGRFNAGGGGLAQKRANTIWYYTALVGIFARRSDSPMLRELEALVTRMTAPEFVPRG
jgi:(p)ppGpp synthase/HD superfamily hydrolase